MKRFSTNAMHLIRNIGLGAALCMCLTVCYSPMDSAGGGGGTNPGSSDEASFTIALPGYNGKGGRAVIPYKPTDAMLKAMTYTINIVSRTGAQTLNVEGVTSTEARAAVGPLQITVRAFYQGDLYAEGTITGELKLGPDNFFMVTLHYAGDTVDGVSVSPAQVTVTRGGQPQQFTATVSGTDGLNRTVTWEVTGGTTPGTFIDGGGLLTVALGEAAAALTVKATSTEDTSKYGAAQVTLSNQVVALAPALSGLPGLQTYSVGDTAAALTITVDNGPAIGGQSGALSWQWYTNTVNSNVGGTAIGGETGASFTPPTTASPNTAIVGTRYYYVKVTNTSPDNGDGGTKTVTIPSAVVAVTVNRIDAITPTLGSLPASQTFVAGVEAGAITVSVTNDTAITAQQTASTGTGTAGYAYQWYKNTTNSTTGGTAIGTNNASFIPPSGIGDAGTTWYYVQVTNSIRDNGDGGTKTVTAVSATAKVTVYRNVADETDFSSVSALTYKDFSAGTPAALQTYLNTIKSTAGGYVIIVAGTDHTIGSTIDLANGVIVSLQGSGTITLTAAVKMWQVKNGAKLILRGPTLEGYNPNSDSLLRVETGGELFMHGGTIRGNAVSLDGAGVYVDGGTFTMSGTATITGNEAGYSGGGVFLKGGAVFTMTGGTISNNQTTYLTQLGNGGGGVAVTYGSAFNMSGGTIWGNTSANLGGGVFVQFEGGAGILYKSGGTIYGNDGSANRNTAGGTPGKGHAAFAQTYINDITSRYRDATAGTGVDLDSSNATNWNQ